MRSVELFFDEPTDAALRLAWTALEDAGIPNLGRNPSPSNRPHVTVLAGSSLDPPSVVSAPPPHLTLGGLLLFPAGNGRSVLVRAVVVSAAVLDFHRSVHAAVPGAASGAVDQTAPDRWTPHVTLARRLTPAQVGAAVEVLGAVPVPAPAVVAGVRFWDGEAAVVTQLRTIV